MQTKATTDPYAILGVTPRATADEIQAAFRRLAQIYHPDRYASAPTDVQIEAERRMKDLNEAYRAIKEGTPDGFGPQTDSREERAVREVIRQAQEYEGPFCFLCGHAPVADVVLKAGAGKLIWRTIREWRGALCRNCGVSMFRTAQNETLIKGWWGVISFFANINYIISNMAQFQKVRRLKSPRATPMAAVTPFPAPLSGSSPLYRRAGVYVFLVVILIVGGMIAGAATENSESSGTASSSDAALLGAFENTLKQCGYVNGQYITKVGCSDPAATLRIAATYPPGSSEYRCPSYTLYTTTDNYTSELLCWDRM